MRSFSRLPAGKGGQTAVEYMLTTLALTVVFASMYGYLQKSLTTLFKAAGMAILTPRFDVNP